MKRYKLILLFDNDQILLYNNESIVANLIRLHVSLSTIWCTLASAQRPVGEGRWVMSLSGSHLLGFYWSGREREGHASGWR